MHTTHSERVNAGAMAGAILGHSASLAERVGVSGVFHLRCFAPAAHDLPEYIRLRDKIAAFEAKGDWASAFDVREEFLRVELREVWRKDAPNTVVTVGKNYLLDNGLAGSAYTAAFYLGLISNVSYTAIAAADTMASHAGWTESTAYSNSTRVSTGSWNAASAGSKAIASAAGFNINATDTIKGAFLTTNSTKGGTTGTLYSAGLFSGGDQPVVNGNTLNVSYTASA